jgi:hypothetical protein
VPLRLVAVCRVDEAAVAVGPLGEGVEVAHLWADARSVSGRGGNSEWYYSQRSSLGLAGQVFVRQEVTKTGPGPAAENANALFNPGIRAPHFKEHRKETWEQLNVAPDSTA